jgi:hypothetical protein
VAATVVKINRSKGWVAVQTDGGYTIFELLGGYDVDVGDVIEGDFRALGGETYANRTKGVRMDVFVQVVDAGDENLRTLMA